MHSAKLKILLTDTRVHINEVVRDENSRHLLSKSSLSQNSLMMTGPPCKNHPARERLIYEMRPGRGEGQTVQLPLKVDPCNPTPLSHMGKRTLLTFMGEFYLVRAI